MKRTLERKPEVLKRCGFSNSTLYVLISKGQFPKPIKLSERSVAWVSDEVDQWIENRITESREPG